MNKRVLYLVDASIYIFRAWFSLPDSMVNADGQSVNAVHGYANFLCQLLEEVEPGYIAVAFDESLQTSFRNRIYSGYKANRETAPDELKNQFMLCRKLTEAMGVSTFSSKKYEADDLIGTIAQRMRRNNFNMVYVTADKDLSQLMRQGDCFWNFAKQQRHAYNDCREVFGVKPEQMIDYLSLCGDSVDNIPGVPGIGAKIAISLLAQYTSLDGIYKNIDTVKEGGLRGARRIHTLLLQHREQALMSRQLATIACNAPIKATVKGLQFTGSTSMRINRFCNKYGLGARLRNRLLSVVEG